MPVRHDERKIGGVSKVDQNMSDRKVQAKCEGHIFERVFRNLFCMPKSRSWEI